MKNVYIDLRFSFSISKKSGKFNGGNNYTIRVLELLDRNKKDDVKLNLVCGKSTSKDLESFLNLQNSNYLELDSLTELYTDINSVLFIPQVNDSNLYAKELKNFKRNNKDCKIFVTIHDRRHKDLIYDKYAGALKGGIKSNSIVLGLGRKIRSYGIDKALKRIAILSDRVFTVSNYSLQRLNSYKDVKSFNFHYVGIDIEHYFKSDKSSDDFILFVNAGRAEKNFIRALKAFENLKANSKNTIKLIATGLSDSQIEKIKNSKFCNSKFLENNVILKGYVENEELHSLFRNCKLLLFTSLNEGMGLPVAEAILCEKPVVASWMSSMPEILGAAGIYVNPLSIESITMGIERILDEDNYKDIKKFIEVQAKILRERVILDSKILIYEIFYN